MGWPLGLAEHHTRLCKLLCLWADGRVYMQSRLRQAAPAGSFQREAPTPDTGFQYNDTPWGGTLLFFTGTISTEKLIVLLLMEKEMEEAIFKFSFILRVLEGWVTGGCLQLPQPGETRLPSAELTTAWDRLRAGPRV